MDDDFAFGEKNGPCMEASYRLPKNGDILRNSEGEPFTPCYAFNARGLGFARCGESCHDKGSSAMLGPGASHRLGIAQRLRAQSQQLC